LPNKKSAEKRVLTTLRNRERNHAYKSSIRTALKKALGLAKTDAPETELAAALSQAQSLVDRAILKGIVPKNKGARDKSRLQLALNRHAAAAQA
jgi:small subunit ribosomal protein S20